MVQFGFAPFARGVFGIIPVADIVEFGDFCEPFALGFVVGVGGEAGLDVGEFSDEFLAVLGSSVEVVVSYEVADFGVGWLIFGFYFGCFWWYVASSF